MAMKQCNHDSFMAVYEGDLNEKCPACKLIEETAALSNEMLNFVNRCKKLGIQGEKKT